MTEEVKKEPAKVEKEKPYVLTELEIQLLNKVGEQIKKLNGANGAFLDWFTSRKRWVCRILGSQRSAGSVEDATTVDRTALGESIAALLRKAQGLNEHE